MEDKDLIKTYAIGIFMLALLDEWSKLERTGGIAKAYNTITKKHNVFNKQIFEISIRKRKKCSKKCDLFNEAKTVATKAWNKAIPATKDITISINTTLHNLYRLNAASFERVYGLREEVFREIGKTSTHGVIFQSCKVARVMTDELTVALEEHISKYNKEEV